MPQSDEQTKDLPQPAPSIQNRLAPSQETTDKNFRRFHYHSISDSSAYGSNDSSPTTTISTVDDSSATEPSPGSSPESPPPNTFAVSMHRPRTSDDSRPFFELQKQPPPRKGRNLKNLAVNTSRAPGRPTTSSSLPIPNAATDELASDVAPSFVKPHTPSKRKPSNLGLTLLTASPSKPPLQEIRLAIPPTPGLGRPGALRHFQSSPSLPLLSELVIDDGPSRPTRIKTTLETIMSPTESRPNPFGSDDEEERNFDVPLSREEKPEAYPHGPICVYEPYIDLYLEPTAEQAQEYDVIMNVASEVRNPFAEDDQPVTDEPDIRIDGGGGIQYAPKRDRIPPKRPDTEPGLDHSPTTPKATPNEATFNSDDIALRNQKEPEYIHVKWEHNSDIVPDLLYLVKLIDEKVLQGKRVLIHCQCGVSRSASLVVAYGLYKDPNLSVQQAYDEVKSRSKWIGPNMNLIMQLQEFRTSLMHGGRLPSNRGMTPITPGSALNDWRGPPSSISSGLNSSRITGVPPIRTQVAEALPVVISGPSSAPNDTTRPPTDGETSGQRARAVSAVKPGTAYVDPAGWVVPALPTLKVMQPGTQHAVPATVDAAPENQSRQESSSTTPTELARSPTTEAEFALTPLQPSPEFDPADSFGLMSPSSTEFSSSPFDRSALLAQLGMGSLGQEAQDPAPRRSVSLRAQRPTQPNDGEMLTGEPKPNRKLRIKVSSPDMREQQQLQSLRSTIEASQHSARSSTFPDGGDALLSPRAEEFTQNPFALSLSLPPHPAASPEPPKTPSDTDPRSPAQKGVSPITRNILDVL